MKSLNTIMKEVFQEYLIDIKVDFKKSAKLGQLIEIVERCNRSCPHRATGLLTESAVKRFEEQFKGDKI